MALFHELHPDPVFCTVEEWKDLLAGRPGSKNLFEALRAKKLILTDASEDLIEFEATEKKLLQKLNQPTVLYLMTAQGCNFDCKYCPVPEIARKYGDSRLSKEDAIAGIDLWLEHLKDVYDPQVQYFIIFYGGEPLLNKETIKASLEYIKVLKDRGQLPSSLNLMIATNGSLFDEAMITLCKTHKVMVAVGLDGPQQTNDVLKVYDEQTGTYDRIVEVIRLLVANGIQTFASVSITPFNIDQISTYSAFFEKLGITKFGFNFLKGKKLVELVGKERLDEYYHAASRGVIENAKQQPTPGFEYQMEKKQIAFDERDFFPVDCTCYGNQLVIQPDGQISNCPFTKQWLGNVRSVDADFRIWNQPVVEMWRQRLPLYHPGEAKALSGGGCAWSSLESKGDVLAPDDSSVVFSDEVLNELIWSRYDQRKN
jgi:sulfatase maturation enzyme AslB (radical SAM superfamily)